MKTLVLASNNKNKIKEIREIFTGYQVKTMEEVGYINEIEENGKDFYENSKIKAQTIYDYFKSKNTPVSVIADDSGLCVNALNGEPGLYSARYAGDHDSQKNRNKLLDKLKDIKDRSAYFICVMTMIKENGDIITSEGRTYGTITYEEIGSKEFGYDCIFLSDDLHKTFGEALPNEKNKISHRGKAIQNLLEKL